MADRRISELSVIPAVAGDDALAIVDTSLSETNKVSVESLLRSAPAGTAAAPSIAFVDDPDTGFYRSAANELSISTGGSQRVVVNSTGNVGVGTNSPGSLLHLKSTTAEIIQTMETSTGTVKLYANNDDFIVDADQHRFRSEDGATERMRIDSAGRVGIGVSNPSEKLEVDGKVKINASTGPSQLYLSQAGTTNGLIQGSGGAGTDLLIDAARFLQLGSVNGTIFNSRPALGGAVTERMRIDSAGNVGIGTSSPGQLLHLASSDPRLNIEDTDSTSIFQLRNTGGAGYLQVLGNSSMIFSTNATERMRVGAGGNVGIGTSSPAGPLNVAGTGAAPSLTHDTANLVNLDQGSVQLAMGVDPVAPYGTYLQGRDSNNGARTLLLNPVGGAVGIGTRNPLRKLHIDAGGGDGATYIQITNADTGQTASDGALLGLDSAEGLIVWNQEAEPVRFGTSAFERMRITSAGNVGIGTSSPGETLEVNGTIKATDINFTGLATYADDTAAGTGGLVAGDVYKTSTGELRIKL